MSTKKIIILPHTKKRAKKRSRYPTKSISLKIKGDTLKTVNSPCLKYRFVRSMTKDAFALNLQTVEDFESTALLDENQVSESDTPLTVADFIKILEWLKEKKISLNRFKGCNFYFGVNVLTDDTKVIKRKSVKSPLRNRKRNRVLILPSVKYYHICFEEHEQYPEIWNYKIRSIKWITVSKNTKYKVICLRKNTTGRP